MSQAASSPGGASGSTSIGGAPAAGSGSGQGAGAVGGSGLGAPAGVGQVPNAGGSGLPPGQVSGAATNLLPDPGQDWRSTLPEDLRSDLTIQKYDSVEALARGHVSATSMLGREKIPMPKTPEEYREVYKKLGMPETHQDYKFDEKDYGIPRNLYPETQAKADKALYAQWSHDLGLSNTQAAQLYDRYMQYQGEQVKQQVADVDRAYNETGQILRQEWGEAMDTNLKIANRAMAKVFGLNASRAIEASGLGRNPDFVKGMYSLGTRVLEEIGIDKRGKSSRTPQQLDGEIAELQAHPAYFDKTHPEHKAKVDQVYSLMQRRYPERKDT